jgi:hypothetical protein
MVENLQVAANVRGDSAAKKDTGARNENEIGTGTKDQGGPAVLFIGGTLNQSGEKVNS